MTSKTPSSSPSVKGGGVEKILYVLKTAKRIGIKKSTKALLSKNACKSCGLGMGGQRGGMVNEAGDFPSVCNKSVQAQQTDIQPAIPLALFEHTIQALRELSAHQIEHAGRLAHPLYKAPDSERFQPITWDAALDLTVKAFADTQANRSFFYSSGRSSNEAGFGLQLLARLYGTNNVNNCSYYCHQATGVAMGNTLGTGTATVQLDDLKHCDTIFVIGANPASNHPRFIYQLKACRDRGGKVIVINPAKEPGLVRFGLPKSPASLIKGGSEIATHYVQPNIGGDIALTKGIAKAIIENRQQDSDFIEKYCENYDYFLEDIHSVSWSAIEMACGVSQEQISQIAECYAQSENTVFCWGMGLTHHQHGCDNVEAIINLALLRGMVGSEGRGLLPLRGHSNVQGIGTMGVKPQLTESMAQKLEAWAGTDLPKEKGLDTYHALKAAVEGDIDVALIVGGNLYSATPNAEWAAKALDSIPLKVFLTTTLNHGHLHGNDNSASLILPVKARDEEDQSTTQESMFNFVRLSDGGIERLDGLRSEVSILMTLGEKLLPKYAQLFQRLSSHNSLREGIAETVEGMAELKNIGETKQEFHIANRVLHTPAFSTASGKAKFCVHMLPKLENQDFPLLLASVRSEGQFNSIIYEEHDTYRYKAKRWSVLLSREDMARHDLEEGDKVHLVSENGRMDDVTVVAFHLTQGNVLAYYPEANRLAGDALDPRSHTPAFKSIPVRLEKPQAFNVSDTGQ